MSGFQKCILDEKKKGGCASCPPHCQHRIALQGLNNKSGRMGATGMPEEYRGVTLANSPARKGQEALYESLERYVDKFTEDDVKSVYLYSESPGTGKTTTACALLNEWIMRSYIQNLKEGKQTPQQLGMFLDINEMQSDYNLASMTNDEAKMKQIGKLISDARTSPYLVVDDIGVREATEAFRGYVHTIINARSSNGLPTVFTSNLEIDEMARMYDERLFDRIRDNSGVMRFSGKSKRRHVGK